MATRYIRRNKWRPEYSPLGLGQLPPHQDSFSGADLCALSGMSLQGLTGWRKEGLIPPAPEPRRGARYGREVARRVAAIGLVGVRTARLRRFEEMIPLILDEAPPPATPTAAAPTTPATAASSAAPTSAVAPSLVTSAPTPLSRSSGEPAALPLPGSTWTHIELLPGLQLQVAAGATRLWSTAWCATSHGTSAATPERRPSTSAALALTAPRAQGACELRSNR